MVARLRAKPGGEEIGVTIGDFSTTRVDGTFSLAYLVFNTIGNLTTQAAQVACFQNVAAHLEPGGCFVIETGVPGVRYVPPGETMHVFDASPTHWGVDEYDMANQGLVSHHFNLVDGRFELFSIPFRYAWPAELDLMAQLGGMTVRERWGDWDRRHSRARARSTSRCGRSRGPRARRSAGETPFPPRPPSRFCAEASPQGRPSLRDGRDWDRTSDLPRVKRALSR